MRNTPYYSIRVGKNPLSTMLDLDAAIKFLIIIYNDLTNKGYFQEALGIGCVDGYQPGTLGEVVASHILLKMRKSNIWPIETMASSYAEDDFFDIIEFLYDHVSCPIDGYYHTYSNCGMHYHSFDSTKGRDEFRIKINEILQDYLEGYELSSTGEIQALVDPGLDHLLATNLPSTEAENVDSRIRSAISKFRRHRASAEDKREAIRLLVDVMEYLRPQIKEVISDKDENDLFNIANNFGIRHHNTSQKTCYDQSVWYGWMFFYYLATIHALLRLINIRNKNII